MRGELEHLAAFAVGFFVGMAIIGLAFDLVEEWVIQSDLADRRRVREIVREELADRVKSTPMTINHSANA
jgi:hypothetical protein